MPVIKEFSTDPKLSSAYIMLIITYWTQPFSPFFIIKLTLDLKVPFAEHPRCNPIFETENNIPLALRWDTGCWLFSRFPTILTYYPYDPWDWYIYLHEWLAFMVNVSRKIYQTWMVWVMFTKHIQGFLDVIYLYLEKPHDGSMRLLFVLKYDVAWCSWLKKDKVNI